MSRLASAFAAAQGRTGLVPYIVAGYPDPDTCLRILRGFAQQGVLAVEVGVPFSDPIADGPDIQRACERALARGSSCEQALALVEALRRESDLPVVLMSYLNPVLRGGIDAFAERARDWTASCSPTCRPTRPPRSGARSTRRGWTAWC
jgi:tryptophan synthase alpha chain